MRECGDLSINRFNKQFNNLKGDYSKTCTMLAAIDMRHKTKTKLQNINYLTELWTLKYFVDYQYGIKT